MKIYVKKIKITYSVFLVALILLLAGCGGPKFEIEGEVKDAPDASILLEKADFTGTWLVIDSVRTDSDGKFKMKIASPETPDLYRLSYAGSYIYLPVDSIEHLTLTANGKNFGAGFTLAGSDQAVLMTQFQQKLGNTQPNDIAALEDFKRWVVSHVVLAAEGHPTVMAYYALTCRIPSGQLFDMANPEDAKVFGAVANAYKQYRPEDPRSVTLERMAIQAMRNMNAAKGRKKVVEAPESSIIDFELNDNTGTPRKLSSITSNGRPTLLIFSLMDEDKSPMVNRGVAQLYEKYGKNMDFVMVCLDTDIAVWRERVRALPWMTMIDPAGNRSLVAANYNLKGLPTFFLFTSGGELKDRADSFAELTPKLSSLK